jgi:hypothetical protein
MKMDLFDSPPRQQPKFPARAEGRSLPFSEDGEKGVLCSLLLSPVLVQISKKVGARTRAPQLSRNWWHNTLNSNKLYKLRLNLLAL